MGSDASETAELQPSTAPPVAALVQRDLAGKRREFFFRLPTCVMRHALQLLDDPRDEPLLHLLLNLLLLTLPAACLLFAGRPSHLLGAACFVCNYVIFLQRFMLMLHFSEHRRLFKPGYGLLNQIVPYVICPLFGVPSGMYRLHHVIMHHVENNNADGDASATEQYQRDNFVHFLCYWTKYWLLAWVQLPYYAARRRRYQWLARSLAAEVAYLAAVRHLWRLNPTATLWTLVIPFFVSSLALMFGNWSQHIFVDPDHPRDTYRLAYNVVGHPCNQLSFNDGYHILHHLNSRTHWTDLPVQFLATLQQHDDNQGLVFQGVDVFEIGVAVFTGRLSWLAEHLVPCGPKQAAWSKEHVVQLLRHRLRPVSYRA